MASKLVVFVALFAASHASPVLINGVFTRDGRAFSISQATNTGDGVSKTFAKVHGDVAQATGSSTDGNLARDGFYYPGQAQLPGVYYPYPAPATVYSHQKFEVPAEGFPTGIVYSNSVAQSDGVNERSSSVVKSSGDGIAESDTRTGGSSATHAKTIGNGYGTATLNNRNGYRTAYTSAKNLERGSVDTSAQSTGTYVPVAATPIAAPAGEIEGPTVVDAKTQNYVPTYNAALAPVKSFSQKPISWRFGTLYDVPTVQNGYVAAKTVNTYSQGVANANANLYGAYGSFRSAANEAAGYESADASADPNNAISKAELIGFGKVSSAANSNQGVTSSKSNTRSGYSNMGTNVNTYSNGFGKAKASAKIQKGSLRTTFVDSSANAYGNSWANADAQNV